MSGNDFGGSFTPPQIKDLWQTPRWLFDYYNGIKNFSADIASNEVNHLCPLYFTEEDDAFTVDFETLRGTNVWCNPPYSDIRPWVDLATRNRDEHGVGTVMLVPADVSVGWFNQATQVCDRIEFITCGRVNFVRADTQEEVKGNPKGSVMLIWNNKRSKDGCITTYIPRFYIKDASKDIPF